MPNKVHFRKELVSRPFMVQGASVPFEVLAGNSGVIALDSEKDSVIITALNAAAEAQRGGVVKITAEEYEDIKKKRPLARLERRSGEMLRQMPKMPNPFSQGKKAAAPAAAGEAGKSARAEAAPVQQPVSPPPTPDPVQPVGDVPKFAPKTAPMMEIRAPAAKAEK